MTNKTKAAIEILKDRIRNYIDFYGCKIHYEEEIDEAQTHKELDEILSNYHKFLESQLCDAQNHLDNFRRSLNLDV